MSASRACLLSVITGLLSGICLPPAHGGQPETEAAFARVERLRQIGETIPEEMIRTRAIFDEALADGVRTGEWSDAEQATRRKTVDAALFNMLPARPYSGDFEEQNYRFEPGSRKSPTFGITLWLRSRLLYLSGLRKRVRLRQIEATLEYAELKWLEARTKAELAPAIKALEDARMFNTVADSSRREGRHFDRYTSGDWIHYYVTPYDFLTILTSRDPFFLPDPDTDPEGFARGCALWRDMEALKHTFVLRPAVRREFARRWERFYRPAGNLFAELNASIMAEAGSKRIGEHVAKIIPFTARNHELRFKADRSLLEPRPDFSPIDFRDMPRVPLSTSTPDDDPAKDPKNPAVIYRNWVEMLKAEESGDSNRAMQKWNESKESFAVMPEPVGSYMMARYASGAPRNLVAPDAFDLTPTAEEIASGSFLDTLRRLASKSAQRDQPGMAGLGNVVRAWEISEKNDWSTSVPGLSEPPWPALSKLRGGPALLAFLDRRVRQELARIAGEPLKAQPGILRVAIREQVGRFATLDQFDQARKALRLAAISGAMEPPEIARYSRAMEVFSNTHEIARASDQDPQSVLRNVLRDAPDATLGEIAARKIVELRKAGPKKP